MQEVKKEVQTIEKEVQKDALLDIVFSSLEAGKSTKQIIKEQSISKQKLQYYLDKLKSMGKIRKISYGVWQTSKDTVANYCRGHGFMWHIKLPKEIKVWDKLLESKHINFKSINGGHTFQFYFKDRKVWASSNSIIIYEIESFFGNNAVETRKLAFFKLRSLLIDLESKLGINLRKNESFIVKVSRQHYSLIKNCLAIQCNEEGKKIKVSNENGLWFEIDNSFNLDEAENVHPKTALVDSLGIQKYFNEHKETKFEVTPKAILNYQLENTKQLNQLTNVLADYGTHIKAHTQSIISLSKAIPELVKLLKQTQEENKNLKQRRLDQYG